MSFLKQHNLQTGFLLVAILLVFMLCLQIWFLTKLKESEVAADKLNVRNFLAAVADDIASFYKGTAEATLNVPSQFLREDGYRGIEDHFRKSNSRGVKAFFVLHLDESGRLEILFYSTGESFSAREPDAGERGAITVACSPWLLLLQQRGVMTTAPLDVHERDPENRIILKPILDSSSRISGIAGMILDPAFFGKYLLPKLIHDHLHSVFSPERREDFIVSLYDGNNSLVYSTGPKNGHDNELTRHWVFIFADWSLRIQNRNLTPEQWAQRSFLVSLFIVGLMAFVLLGGIFFTMKSASQAMKLSVMKTDFVSNVSHELRTPLSSIRVLAEYLRFGQVQEPEKVRAYGEYIDAEAHRLTHLIDNILDFSKIESGQKMYQFEETDILQLVSETVDSFEMQAKQSGINILLKMPRDPLPTARIDKDAIAEALFNLLDNAVKYSGSNQEVSVQLGREDGLIVISVEDHGIGLRAEEKERIFEKFYRASSGFVHNVTGSGLGLSIAKHIVESHQGKITVDSEFGQGSTFTIHIPLARSSSHA